MYSRPPGFFHPRFVTYVTSRAAGLAVNRDPVAATPPLILIVDDTHEMQELLAAVCRRNGYDVIVANDAEDGVQKAHLMKPDAILLDIMLPGMRGSDALPCLKRHPQTEGIPVIVVTGYAVSAADEWPTLAAAVLRKPFLLEDLEHSLAGALRPVIPPRT